MKRLAMLLALSPLACGGRDDCKEARVAAEKEVAAAVALVEGERQGAARELDRLEVVRDQTVAGRPRLLHAITRLDEEMGCSRSPRCCDEVRAWLKRHPRPETFIAVSKYFPALAIAGAEVRLASDGSLEQAGAELDGIVERLQKQMDEYAGGTDGLEAVKATCESIRGSAAELRAAAQTAPPEPTIQRAALEAHEKRESDLRRWRAALASGKPVDMPAVDPDAADPVRKAHKALEVYQAHCH